MPSYQKCYYCKNCKTNVTTDEKGHCKKCGGSSLNITWSARFRIIDVTGEKHKRLTGYETRKKAEAAYVEFMSNYSPIQSAKKNRYIFEDTLKEYFSTYENLNEASTLYDKKSTFELYITPYFTNRDIKTISKSELQAWQNLLWKTESKATKKKLSHNYLIKIRGFFNNFLEYCETMHDIPNQLRKIKLPINKELKKDIRFWEIEEFNKFILKVDDITRKTLWMTFMYTGARLNEIRALSDSDIKGNKIFITKALAGKKLKEKRNTHKKTKNGKSVIKQIPTILADQIERYKKWKKENDVSPTYLFGGNTPLPEMTIRRGLKNDILKAEVSYIHPHGFRHSYVSMLINLGVTTKIIAELIGDTEAQVIETYGHLYKDATDKAIELLNINIT